MIAAQSLSLRERVASASEPGEGAPRTRALPTALCSHKNGGSRLPIHPALIRPPTAATFSRREKSLQKSLSLRESVARSPRATEPGEGAPRTSALPTALCSHKNGGSRLPIQPALIRPPAAATFSRREKE